MTHDEAMAICEQVLKAAGEDAEVTLVHGASALLRFARNEPIQHTTSHESSLHLRWRHDGRLGEARVNGWSDAEIETLVRQAKAQAELLPAEDDLLPSVGAQALLAVTAHHADSTPGSFDAEQRAAAAEALARPAKAAGLTAAGICSVGAACTAKATSHGFRASYARTLVDLDVTVQTDDSTGWASGWSRSSAALDAGGLGRAACERALQGRSPQHLDAGTYRVVLGPAAVATALHYVAGSFNARAVAEGRTYLTDRLGTQLFGGRINVRTDITHPGLQGAPFDDDGLAVRRVELVRNGVVANLCHDRRTAVEQGAEPTGYSSGGRVRHGAGPHAIVLEGGTAQPDDLLAVCDEGIYVTRLWYTNWIDPRECSITGMTRDGVFRIRKGKLAEPLTNARIGQNLIELFNGVEALGPAEVQDGVVAPAMAVSAFTFSSETTF